MTLPSFENGVATSIRSLMMGVVESSLLMVVIAVAASLQPPINVVLILISIGSMLSLARRMNYWGIAYTVGWFLAFVCIAPSILQGWEYSLTGALGLFYISLKIWHKVGR